MNTNLRRLTTSGVLLAMASVLSMIVIFQLPEGGKVTAVSMAPIIIISLRYGTPWGIFSGIVYACLQMVQRFYAPPVQDFISFFLVIMLDYVIAFGCLGLASAISKPFGGNKSVKGVAFSTAVVILIRYICHFASGIIIWESYAPENMPVWLYSLSYNGSYMIPELIITTIVLVIMCRYIDFSTLKPIGSKKA